ncbi:hypothetical protein WJX73_009304 [Symbiochloris irregularis]|uniref:Cupin 2 conserved barrel domain-containing protein n=1 Tax=Symbiochloris irregularis TaxID=706552 RepID=A0AAW1PEM4_9CHLO
MRGTVIQRMAINSQGQPQSTVRFFVKAGDTSRGGYKDYPSAPPVHTHMYQDETFEVLKGRAGYVLNDKEGILDVGGGKILAPMGENPHTFWNADPMQDFEIQFEYITLIGNSTDFPAFLETLFGLQRDYKTIDNVNLLQLFLLFWVRLLQHQ